MGFKSDTFSANTKWCRFEIKLFRWEYDAFTVMEDVNLLNTTVAHKEATGVVSWVLSLKKVYWVYIRLSSFNH